MRKQFRLGTVIPWLSLATPLFLFLILQGLGYLSPSLFCVEMNPGGKEFICGPGYTHIGIQLIQLVGFLVWVWLLVTGGAEIILGRATRVAVIAWSVSALLLVGLLMLLLYLPANDCP